MRLKREREREDTKEKILLALYQIKRKERKKEWRMKWIKNDNIANEGNTKEKKSRERWIELKKN